MRVIARSALREYWDVHPDVKQPLQTRYRDTRAATWSTYNELKRDHPSASILPEHRVVFNIEGNRYRLIVLFNLRKQRCYIRFVGTHAEYDKVDANTV